MYLGFTINAFSGASLLAANLTNDLGNWMFIAKLIFILFAMVNLELTRMRCSTSPLVAAPGGLPKHSRADGRSRALVLWGFAMVAGRFTAYPNFVEAWLGF